MLAEHVEAGLLQEDDVAARGFLGRRGKQAFGPPALVERAVLEKRFVVEQQRHLAGLGIDTGGDLAHPEIAFDAVAWFAGADRRGIGLTLAPRHRRPPPPTV